jgi:multiple sugar transport system substrate-binding protein
VPDDRREVQRIPFPSIAASMKALTDQQAAKGADFSVFNSYLTSGELVPCPVYNNGAALTNALLAEDK